MLMSDIVISGSGLFIPPFTITNDELVEAYNAYANRFNEEHADAIAAGETEALPLSSSEFIEKAAPPYVPGHQLLAGRSVLITAAAGAGIGYAAAQRAVGWVLGSRTAKSDAAWSHARELWQGVARTGPFWG